MGKKIELAEKRFTRLLVLKDTGKRSAHGNVRWLCKCDCGNFKEAYGADLTRNFTKSCGCYSRDYHTTHGDSGTFLYRNWMRMIARCHQLKDVNYFRYGAKGIKVDPTWHGSDGYLRFKKFALKYGYKKGLSIDRIDNDGNYEPSNCRFVTRSINSKKVHTDRDDKFNKTLARSILVAFLKGYCIGRSQISKTKDI